MLNIFRPLTLAALLAVSASSGFAGTITFDTLAPSTALNTQFQKSEGVTFVGDAVTVKGSGHGGSTVYAAGSVFQILIDADRNYDTISLFGSSLAGLPDGDFLIWFEPNTVSPTILGASELSQPLPFQPSGGQNDPWFKGEATVSGRITRITVNAPAGFLVDDITFLPASSGTVVPEPQSFALAGLALAAAGWTSRRRAAPKRQA